MVDDTELDGTTMLPNELLRKSQLSDDNICEEDHKAQRPISNPYITFSVLCLSIIFMQN